MSLESVAAHIGKTHGTLSRIERGLTPYDQDLLENLALLYGCDPAELLARDPSQPTSIFSLMERADPQQRRQLERMAEAMLDYRADDRHAS